jgi:hypothetical protein
MHGERCLRGKLDELGRSSAVYVAVASPPGCCSLITQLTPPLTVTTITSATSSDTLTTVIAPSHPSACSASRAASRVRRVEVFAEEEDER